MTYINPLSSARPEFTRAVVTGGAGFFGSHLCETSHGGTRAVCLDSFVTGTAENVSHLLANPRFELVNCDMSEIIEVSGAVDLVLRFASPASPADYLKPLIDTLCVGGSDTRHAIELAEAKRARFILVATADVYGEPPTVAGDGSQARSIRYVTGTVLARDRLAWEPRVDWQTGLADTIAWFAQRLAPAGAA